MLSKKEKNTLFIVNMIVVAISIGVIIPYKLSGISNIELILKFLVAPILILALFIFNLLIKNKNYQPKNKYKIVSTYYPIFSYVEAAFFSGLLLLLRTTSAYSWSGWLICMGIVSSFLVLMAFFTHTSYRWLALFNKKEATIIDVLFLVLFVIATIGLFSLGRDHLNLTFESQSAMYIWVPAIFTALFSAFHILRLIYMSSTIEEFQCVSKSAYIENWKEKHKRLRAQAEADILFNFYSISKKELSLTDEFEEFMEDVNEEIEEILSENPISQEEVEKEPEVIEKVVQVVDHEALAKLEEEKLALEEERARLQEQLQLFENEMTRLVDEEQDIMKKLEPKKIQKKKKIKPTFEEVLEHVRAIPKVVEKSNSAKTSIRFYIGTKQFLAVADSINDYKITFLYDLDEVVDLIVNIPSIVKAKTPKGENWFKLTNSGEYNKQQIFSIIDRSVKMVSGKGKAKKEVKTNKKASDKEVA